MPGTVFTKPIPLSLQPLLNSHELWLLSPSRSFSPTGKVANKKNSQGFQLKVFLFILYFILASLLTTLLTSLALSRSFSPLSNNSQIPYHHGHECHRSQNQSIAMVKSSGKSILLGPFAGLPSSLPVLASSIDWYF